MLIKIKVCNKVIEIDSPHFPEKDFYISPFCFNTQDTDVKIKCILCDKLSEEYKKNPDDKTKSFTYIKNDKLYRLTPMGTDEGSLTVFESEREIISYVNKKNSKVVLDERYFWHSVALDQVFLSFDTLFCHASFIKYRGEGILFSAPSGTGKSTQASLWEKYMGAEIINGDKAGISVRGNEVLCHGVPFCGTSGICKNETLPLKAIVLLEQAPVNEIIPLKGIEALSGLSGNIYLDCSYVENKLKLIDILVSLTERVNVYLLRCTPDKEACETLKEELYKTF